jgi:hypothetical protein
MPGGEQSFPIPEFVVGFHNSEIDPPPGMELGQAVSTTEPSCGISMWRGQNVSISLNYFTVSCLH